VPITGIITDYDVAKSQNPGIATRLCYTSSLLPHTFKLCPLHHEQIMQQNSVI